MKKAFLLFSLFPAVVLAQAAPSGPVEITSSELDVRHADGKAVFVGNVEVRQGGLTLNAPRLEVTYGKKGQGDVQDLQATGGVTITRNGPVAEKATGTEATYTPSTAKLVLTGDVELTRGPNVLAGDKLVYDIASGNAKVTNSKGPVKARFIPQGTSAATSPTQP